MMAASSEILISLSFPCYLYWLFFSFIFAVFLVRSIKSGFQLKPELFGYYIMISGSYLNFCLNLPPLILPWHGNGWGWLCLITARWKQKSRFPALYPLAPEVRIPLGLPGGSGNSTDSFRTGRRQNDLVLLPTLPTLTPGERALASLQLRGAESSNSPVGVNPQWWLGELHPYYQMEKKFQAPYVDSTDILEEVIVAQWIWKSRHPTLPSDITHHSLWYLGCFITGLWGLTFELPFGLCWHGLERDHVFLCDILLKQIYYFPKVLFVCLFYLVYLGFPFPGPMARQSRLCLRIFLPVHFDISRLPTSLAPSVRYTRQKGSPGNSPQC